MNQQKIEQIFSDEVFVASLLNLDTAEAVQAALQEKGVTLSLDEICQVRDGLVAYANGELSEAELEQVAGGIVVTTLIMIILGVISGTCAAVSGVHEATKGRW